MKIDKLINSSLRRHLAVGKKILRNKETYKKFNYLCEISLKSLESGGKIIFFGNGGSAADSQHLATELTVRFKKNRKAIPALALTTDTSALTAIGNDFTFNDIFLRQLQALVSPNDLVIGISTSGNSKNVIKPIIYCKKKKINHFTFLGNKGGELSKITKNSIVIPSKITSIIQEYHIFFGQLLCEFIEENYCN